ncbi:MAG TPA: class I SAM-dependent methyltransferase, partial [Candidatus Thermoplasmatota archaeon]
MAWFKEHIFVSTTRNAMSGPKPFAEDIERRINMYPVKIPTTNPWDNDFRSQIWRYNPKTDQWAMVHRAPMCTGNKGFEVPRQVGFRCATKFKGASDCAEVLYIASWSTRAGPGPIIMRCADGAHFEEVCEPGFGGAVTQAVRGLEGLKGKLFAATTPRAGSHDTELDVLSVYETRDPVSKVWKQVPVDFGPPTNISIYEMCVFDGHLYAGTLNPTEGFQLWKTDAEGEPPYRWVRVLTKGAFRGKLNEAIISMCEFNGCLYVGGAILNCGYDRVYNVGPAAPELLRVYPDDSWELVVGMARSTPDGTKVPLSGMGPGFSYGLAGYMWRVCAHDGWVYVTTADKTTLLEYAAAHALPENIRWILERECLDTVLDRVGGFDMWRSRDGVQWAPVTRNGFGNRFNLGGRTMASTPYGLFVGTANLFGPEVARKRVAGWTFEWNRDGGAEVWLGRAGRGDAGNDGQAESPGTIRPGGGAPYNAGRSAEDLVREFFGHSGFCNCGYWYPSTKDVRTACENLVEELISFTRPPAVRRVPKPATEEEDRAFFAAKQSEQFDRYDATPPLRDATVLDFGCGTGATTAQLLKHFASAGITAVTTDDGLGDECRRRAPGVKLVECKPSRFRFPPSSFDIIFWVEGLTRCVAKDRVLRRMFAALKPGGCIAASG